MTEEGDREVGAEEALKTEENVRVAEVERKMDDLKSDVQRISEELKNVVSELKKSIVDVRSAVSEIENPFNLLRVISSEKDLNKLSGERFGGQVKTIALPEEEKEALERLEAEREERPEEEKEAVEVAPERLEAEREERPEEEVQPQPLHPERPPPKTGFGYLDWVWSLLERSLSSADIVELARSYEFMGYLPAESTRYISSLAVAAEKAKSKGFSKEELMLNMYKVATISGGQVGMEDIMELIKIAEDKISKTKRKDPWDSR